MLRILDGRKILKRPGDGTEAVEKEAKTDAELEEMIL